MKTIKERAREFVDAPCDHRCKKCKTLQADCRFYNDQMSFIAGAESEHEELTRWHDPKEELPDYYHPVEIKYLHSQFIEVAIAWLGVIDDGAYIWTIDNTDKAFFHDEILGWREILE